MHISGIIPIAQSANPKSPKSKICTLNCSLEETLVLQCIESNPKITQKELAASIKKSERTIKTITSALVEKSILVRRNGKRNGWWEILAPIRLKIRNFARYSDTGPGGPERMESDPKKGLQARDANIYLSESGA